MNSGHNTQSNPTSTFSILQWLKHLYEIAPVNGSTLTGRPFLQIPHLPGHPILGQALKISGDDGEGMGRVVLEAAKLAKENNRGMCTFWIGNRMAILITKPDDIRQLIDCYDFDIERGWPLKSFGNLFGKRNIFNLPEYTKEQKKEWQDKRNLLRRWVFQEDELKKFVVDMQPVIDEHIKKIRIEKKVTLMPFLIVLTMDIFARTRLGTKNIMEAAPKISSAISTAMTAAIDPKNRLLQMMADLKKMLCMNASGPLEKNHDSLMNAFVELLIEPNKEEILKSNNILREIASVAKTNLHSSDNELTFEDLKAEDVLKDGCTTLLAGHETTQALILFTLLSLTDPKNEKILEKLNEEIISNRPKTGKWHKEDLDKLIYMKMILKETLRMFPPVPILPREVMNTICIANIPRCNTKQQYEEAMAKRNKAEDIWLQKGNLIFISPMVTQKLKSAYQDSDKFIPERWQENSDPTSDQDPGKYLPFGIGHRACIGKKISIAEAALVLVNLIEHFNIKIINFNERYTFKMRGTTKHTDPIEAEFEEKKKFGCN